MTDFTQVAQQALAQSTTLLGRWLPDGKLQGREFIAKNPTRNDARAGSFSFNTSTGKWGDFATGDHGTDIISLKAHLQGCSQLEAAQALAAELGITDDDHRKEDLGWEQLTVVPAGAPKPPEKHFDGRTPSARFAYHDVAGNVTSYVSRFDKPLREGQLKVEKEFKPLTLWKSGEKLQWKWKGFDAPRPLFNLHLLARNPESPVVFCEGEAKCLAAGELLPGHIPTCNSNGSNAVKTADLSPLRNRTVLAWPDADKSGQKWLQALSKALRELGCTLSVVNTDGLNESIGYDAKNALDDGWTLGDIQKRITQDRKEPEPVAVISSGQSTLLRQDKKGDWCLVAHSEAAEILYANEFKSLLYFDPIVKEWLQYDDQSGIFKIRPDLMIHQCVHHAIKRYTLGCGFQASYVSGVIACLKYDAIKQHKPPVGFLCFKNGVLNLKTRQLLPHSPDYFFTHRLPFDWLPNASAPQLIIDWLLEATGGNMDQVELIRAFFHAVVVGRPDLQRFLEVMGFGGSGKGTLLRLLCAIVGNDAIHSTKIEHLENNRFETAKIFNKKLVVVTDAEKWHGDVSTLKAITGQDPIRFEEKNKQAGDSFTYGGMVLILANQHTASNDYSSGIQRRKITVAFDHVVPASQRRDLDAEFEPLLPNLLHWVLDMPESEVTAYLRNTSTHVKSLQAIRIENLEATNPVVAWLRSNCTFNPNVVTQVGVKLRQTITTGDETGKVSRVEYQNSDSWLYPNYVQWAEQTGKQPLSHVVFSRTVIDVARNMLGQQHVKKMSTRGGAAISGLSIISFKNKEDVMVCDGLCDGQVIDCYGDMVCDGLNKVSNEKDVDVPLPKLDSQRIPENMEVCNGNHHNHHIHNNQGVNHHTNHHITIATSPTIPNHHTSSSVENGVTCATCFWSRPSATMPSVGRCTNGKGGAWRKGDSLVMDQERSCKHFARQRA